MWWHSSPGSHHWESQAPRVLQTVVFLQNTFKLSKVCIIVHTKDKCLAIYLQLTLADSPQAYFHCNCSVVLGETILLCCWDWSSPLNFHCNCSVVHGSTILFCCWDLSSPLNFHCNCSVYLGSTILLCC